MPNEDKTPEQPTKTGRRPGRPPKTTRTGPFGRGGGLTTKSTRFDPSLDVKTDPVVDPKTTTTRDPTPSTTITITTRCTTGNEYRRPTTIQTDTITIPND